jgi:hypothetical protein
MSTTQKELGPELDIEWTSKLLNSRKQKVEKGIKMKSVKVEDQIAEKVKDLKAYIRAKHKLPVTETQILSQAFEVANKHKDELLRHLRKAVKPEQDDIFEFFLTPLESKSPTDVAREHDGVISK